MNSPLEISQLEDDKVQAEGQEHYESHQNIEDTPIGTAGNQHSINYNINEAEAVELSSLSSPHMPKHRIESSLGDILSNKFESQMSLSLPGQNIQNDSLVYIDIIKKPVLKIGIKQNETILGPNGALPNKLDKEK